ncbi:MAG TPA: DUF2249 domain-containing protein [Gemmatimonadales bacterium]|nr:DUF2249 domain-containing protein [Gemmatimonadales bacterium]
MRPTDRVAQVLARDEALVEVFVRHSPRFAKLRNGALRRVMARLVTVAQAAEMVEVPVAPLVADLNRALGYVPADAAMLPGADGAAAPRADAADEAPVTDEEPAPVEPPAGAPEVELDVRDDLRRGAEPFTRITAALNVLPPGGVLRLRAPFRPVPLIRLVARRGFAHHATRVGDEDWVVRFFRTGRATPIEAAAAPPAPAAEPVGQGDEVWLDVRGLEPPEPLVRTLAAVERLAPGATLVQLNHRVPQHLFPVLRERGFTYAVEQTPDGRVLTRIRRVPA